MNYLKKSLYILLSASFGIGLAGCSAANGTVSLTAAASTDSSIAAAPDASASNADSSSEVSNSYSLVRNVYNWGGGYSTIILPVDVPDSMDYLRASSYSVYVKRYKTDKELINEGSRRVQAVYRCDKQGNEDNAGKYVALSMGVSPFNKLALSCPTYNLGGDLGKAWAICDYTICNKVAGKTWNELDTIYHPDEDKYNISRFTEGDTWMNYASYEPDSDGQSHPLIIWLHGAGGGGTDMGFALSDVLTSGFLTDDVQNIFGGAYILQPQAKTKWKDNGSPDNYGGGNSIYTETTVNLIKDYISKHPDIDQNRIYVGGCSNGGYFTVELMLKHPEIFAAAFPICEAYDNDLITEQQLIDIKDIPTWFVHCAGDPLADPEATTIPTYERLKAAGAKNLHFTYYDAVIDPEYGNTYNAHFSWVYALLNMCDRDYDGQSVTIEGKEVTLFEWLSHQTRAANL